MRMGALLPLMALLGCNGDDGDKPDPRVGELETTVATLTTDLQAANATIDALTDRLEALEQDTKGAKDLLSVVDVDGTEVTFSGVNVHVQSGSGATDDGGTPTGLGNLIVGYDEGNNQIDKTGSHNLVLGVNNAYTSYGGIVSGVDNAVTGAHAAAIAGEQNEVSGTNAVAFAGTMAVVSGEGAATLAGNVPTASGQHAVVVGGVSNEASGLDSVVLGGLGGDASALGTVVAGGSSNSSSTPYGTAPF